MLMVAPWGKTHLRAFPLPEWEAFENTLITDGRTQKGLGRLMRYIVGSVAECPLDKQGRILLPQHLRVEAGLDKEVVLVGMVKHVEIWDKGLWQQENEATSEHFAEFEDQLAAMGVI
jgi:MraZ protein